MTGTASTAPLFLLPRIRGLVDVRKVETTNSSEAMFSADGQGRKWVRKRYVDTGFQPLLAEAVGWFVGRRMGAPVPDAAVCDGKEEERSWLSSYVDHASHWDSARAHFVDNVDELGAMLALDAVIFNGDRHRQNILLVPDPDESHLKAWAIDVGNAYVGQPADFIGLADDAVPPTSNHARGLPLGLLEKGALAAAEKARGLAGTQPLRTFVGEACDLVVEPRVEELSSKLSARLERAEGLVKSYMKALEALR